MLSNAEHTVNQAIANRYQNADKTRKDVLRAIKNYRGLSPKLEKFVFNDGVEKSLMNIYGTIPVRYKGSQYNIPLCIWLLDNYPASPPMVYVKPTQDMLIKPSRHVDQNGKVYLPYLHEWNPNFSDIISLIQVMIMIFGETPPVYAKPKNSQAPQPGPYPLQPGYMPMPGAGAGGSALPYPPGSPANSGQYPNYPNPPSYNASSTPYPVYPPTSSTGYPNPPPPPAYQVSGSTPYPPYPTTTTNFTSGSGDSSTASGLNPSPTNTTNSTSTNPSTTGTITEEHIKASLVSAVIDKVRVRFREIYGAAQAEVSVLRQQQTDLTQGKTKLEGLITKLEQEQTELDKSIRLLRDRETEMTSVLSRLSSATEPLDIDEAVTTTAPLYKQLLNAYAEDQATQDAIYYLGEALRREIIDVDTFLKHVRSLSRKQFQLRAIMTKCREKANMSG